MSEAVVIAIITVIGGGLIGVWVEMVRHRRKETKVVEQTEAIPQVATTIARELTSNSGTSTYDIIRDIRDDIKCIKKDQAKQGERLARVEAHVDGVKSRLEDHLKTNG